MFVRKFALGILVLMLVQGQAWAQSATDASIRKLLEVTEAQKLVDGMYGQLDGMLQAAMKQAVGDVQLSREQLQIIEEAQSKIIALFQREMGWSSLEPMMVEIYRTHFSEAEIQGMLKFYESDVGRSAISKMPAVMQSSMQITQTRMAAMVPQIQQIQADALARLQALCKDSDAPGCKGGT